MLSHRPARPTRSRTLGPTPAGARSASRILGVFLDDIDYLLHADESTKALQLAVLLPHLVTALEDPALRGRCDAADVWVERWLTGDAVDARLAAWRSAGHRGCEPGNPRSAVTESGIKQLRLRRHSRDSLTSAPLRDAADVLPAPGSDLRLAHDLMMAAREWYSEVGMDDPCVQENLSRLAVLRGSNLSV